MVTLPELLVKTRAINLHDMGYTGRGTTVAILDSGVDTTHPYFEGLNIETFDLTGEGVNDDFIHGTHTASILATMAPGAKILSIKILDKEGVTYISTMMRAIQMAVDMGADIINLSVGELYYNCPDTHPLGILVDNLTADGKVILVCAAGNLGPKRSPHIPGSCLGAIAVGSCNKFGRINVWSSRGSVCNNTYPDCVAYGDEIVAAVPYNGWEAISGTSQATPQVSGVLALLKEATGLIFNQEMLNTYLPQGCDRIESKEKNNISGWGIINAEKFLRAIQLEQEWLY